jgi:hypothetical protein
MTRRALLMAAVLGSGGMAGAGGLADPPAPTRVVGWVSDGHCGAKHMKTGGAACVRKCIAGAEHVNPEWKPGGMVFVTEDKRVWKVDNADALWGHESQQLDVLAAVDAEKGSLRVKEIVRVLQQ